MPHYLLVVVCLSCICCPLLVTCLNSQQDQKECEDEFLEHSRKYYPNGGIIPLVFEQKYIDETLERCRQQNKKSGVKRIWKKLVSTKFEPKVDDRIMLHFRWAIPAPPPKQIRGIRCSENEAFISRTERIGYSVTRQVDKHAKDTDNKFYIEDRITIYQVREPEAPAFDQTPTQSDQSASNSSHDQLSDEKRNKNPTPSHTFNNQRSLGEEGTLDDQVTYDDQPLNESTNQRLDKNREEFSIRNNSQTLSGSPTASPVHNYISDNEITNTLTQTNERHAGSPARLSQKPVYDDEPTDDDSLIGIFDRNEETFGRKSATYNRRSMDKSLIGNFDRNPETFNDIYSSYHDEEPIDRSLFGIFDGDQKTSDRYPTPTWDGEPNDKTKPFQTLTLV